jgi:hyperosmotically inducible periplasmic protein
MKNYIKKPMVPATLCALLLTTPYLAHADDKSPSNDTWLKTKIVTSYTLNRHLNPFDITTDVNNGKVVLTGQVENDAEKELAERIARSIDGVSSVDNRLTSDENAPQKPNKFFADVEDASTSTSIYSKLMTRRNIHAADLKVQTNDGVVKLTGNVPTESEKDLAEMIALDTSGVSSVNNELRVDGTQRTALGKASRAISDSWITAKIRSNILFSSGTSGSSVTIDTKSGNVVLSGQTRNGAQKELIEKIAEDISGVNNVKNNLTVYSKN